MSAPHPSPATGPFTASQHEAEPASDAPLSRLAVVAFIAAFLLPLVGIVLGHLAQRRISVTGQRGRPLAVAATVIAYLVTIGAVVRIVAYLGGLSGMLDL